MDAAAVETYNLNHAEFSSVLGFNYVCISTDLHGSGGVGVFRRHSQNNPSMML